MTPNPTPQDIDTARAERIARLSQRRAPVPIASTNRRMPRRHVARKSRVAALILSVGATTGLAGALALEANPGAGASAASATSTTATTAVSAQQLAVTTATTATSGTAATTAATTATTAAKTATTTATTAKAVTASKGS